MSHRNWCSLPSLASSLSNNCNPGSPTMAKPSANSPSLELKLGPLRFHISWKWKHPGCTRTRNKHGWLITPKQRHLSGIADGGRRTGWTARPGLARPLDKTLQAAMKDGWEHDMFEKGRGRGWQRPAGSTTAMSSAGIMQASVFTAHAVNCLVGREQRENYEYGTSCQTDTTRFGRARFHSLRWPGCLSLARSAERSRFDGVRLLTRRGHRCPSVKLLVRRLLITTGGRRGRDSRTSGVHASEACARHALNSVSKLYVRVLDSINPGLHYSNNITWNY